MQIKQPFVLPHPLPLLGASSGQNMVTSQVRGWAARGLSPAAAWAALSPQPSSRTEAADCHLAWWEGNSLYWEEGDSGEEAQPRATRGGKGLYLGPQELGSAEAEDARRITR